MTKKFSDNSGKEIEYGEEYGYVKLSSKRIEVESPVFDEYDLTKSEWTDLKFVVDLFMHNKILVQRNEPAVKVTLQDIGEETSLEF
jgi:hypothetical protein